MGSFVKEGSKAAADWVACATQLCSFALRSRVWKAVTRMILALKITALYRRKFSVKVRAVSQWTNPRVVSVTCSRAMKPELQTAELSISVPSKLLALIARNLSSQFRNLGWSFAYL